MKRKIALFSLFAILTFALITTNVFAIFQLNRNVDVDATFGKVISCSVALEELTNRDYCKTTTNEFFAEAFYMVVSYSNGTEKMHEMIKTELPETYTYINNFLNGLIENN